MTKPRIKAKTISMTPDLQTTEAMGAFAIGAGMLRRRQFFAFQIFPDANNARIPVAISPLCFTMAKAAAAANAARAEGAEEVGYAAVVQLYDPEDADDLVAFGLHEQAANLERAEWVKS